MLLIVAALKEELKVALSQCPDPQKIRTQGVEIWRSAEDNRTIHFLRTGVGPKRAVASLQRALQVLDISRILVVGYAGALDPQLKLGTLVAVEKALECSIDPSDPSLENMKLENVYELASAESFTVTAESMQLPFSVADTLTTAHVWGNPDHKKFLLKKFGASIVDMETAYFAKVAKAHGIVMRCLRVISDEAGDSFLEPFSYDPSAGISKKAGQIMRNGNPVKILRQWKRNTSVARASLGRFLSEYL